MVFILDSVKELCHKLNVLVTVRLTVIYIYNSIRVDIMFFLVIIIYILYGYINRRNYRLKG